MHKHLEVAEKRVHCFNEMEPDELAAVLACADLEHLILDHTRVSMTQREWAFDGITLNTGAYSFPVRISGNFSSDLYCLGYMRRLTEPTWVNGFEADHGTLEIYPPGCDLNYRATRGGEWLAFSLSEATLQAIAHRRLGRHLELPRRSMIGLKVPVDARRRFDALMGQLIARPYISRFAVEQAVAWLSELLDQALRRDWSRRSERGQRRRQLLRRADAYILSHIGQPFDARGLAKSLGISERTLQRLFAEAYGMSPRAWSRCLALNLVRQSLLRPDSRRFTVESLAQDHGFRHMGRFSQYFKQQFGELPSAVTVDR